MSQAKREVDARLPLALLQAMQRQDTPPGTLPDEPPQAFFPHRLGLSGVVEEQIRHFRRRARLRRRVDVSQLEALLELIARRPDAGAVFTAAGRELAGFHFSGPLGLVRRLSRRLPRSLRQKAALRALRTAHDAFLIAGAAAVEAKPLEISATDAVTARVGGYGAACKLYGSLAAGLLELSGLGPLTVGHPECQRHGADRCVWRVENALDR